MLILVCRIGIDCSTCLKLVELEFILMQRMELLKITLNLLELTVDLLDQLECFIFLLFLFRNFFVCIFSFSLKRIRLEVI